MLQWGHDKMVGMTTWGFLLLSAVFLYVALLNDAVSFLGCIVLNGKMVGEWWIGNDSEEVVTVWFKYYRDICLEGLRKQQLSVAGIMVKIWTGCLILLQLSPTYVYQSKEHISTKDYYSSSSCDQSGHMTKWSVNICAERWKCNSSRDMWLCKLSLQPQIIEFKP